MANPNPPTEQLKKFQKGPDPRRNLKGVPKDTIAARKLIRQIGAELVALPKDENGNVRELTRFELLIRAMYGSKAPADRQNLLKALAPGLLKDEIDVNAHVLTASVTPAQLAAARARAIEFENEQDTTE